MRLRAMFGEQELTLERFDLNEAVGEVISQSTVTIASALTDGLPPIIADRRQLQLVIVNLIRYACEAASSVHDRRRELLIRTEREAGNRVRLTLLDTELELLPVSAEALSSTAHSMEIDGLGVGLFVSRSIIDRHRGRFWAQRNEGMPGTTLSFSIPAAE
jgi:signal transduction histidine kinase